MLKNLKLYSYFFFKYFIALFFYSILQLILLQHAYVEVNPGPRKAKFNSFSCCHWNVNSLICHKIAKISQIEPYSYNSTYKYDMICISETYFDSSNLLKIEQFN